MPELPDLEYIIDRLNSEFAGKIITAGEVHNPVIFRVLSTEALDDILPGKTVTSFERHGPFVVVQLSGDWQIVIHPMLAGRFFIEQDTVMKNAAIAARFSFANEKALVYHDNKQMGKIYVLRNQDTSQIPRFASQGMDVRSPNFTEEYFLTAIAKSRKQIRVFLMEQEVISAIGNAYADEILFEAGLHPKTFCYQISESQKKTLYQAIGSVLDWGIVQVRAAGRPLQEKVRDHMKVRNRQGEPCPKCGTKIRRAGVRGFDAFFCPTCQPPQRAQFIDWSK